MDYTKTTPYARYDLDIEAARADLKFHGVDFKLVEEIQKKVYDAISEYGDIPELALVCIVTGYNSKCMADQDREYMYSHFRDDNPEAYRRSEAFQVIDALTKKHEDSLYEVISSWRV